MEEPSAGNREGTQVIESFLRKCPLISKCLFDKARTFNGKMCTGSVNLWS